MKQITLLMTSSVGEYWKLAEYAAPNKLEYCLRHNIAFTFRQHDKISPWGERPRFMLEELERMKEGDWLWFMGTDTLITNMTVDVKRFMQDDAPDLTIAKDMHGINNDVFFLRNTENGRRFLREVLALNTSLPDDQAAMWKVMQEGWLTWRLCPMEPFNSYLFNEYPYYAGMGLNTESEGHWRPGRFVLHLPGLPNLRRFGLMRKHLADVVRE